MSLQDFQKAKKYQYSSGQETLLVTKKRLDQRDLNMHGHTRPSSSISSSGAVRTTLLAVPQALAKRIWIGKHIQAW